MKKKVWKSMAAAVALLALAIGCEQPAVETKPTEPDPKPGSITNTAFIEAVDNAKDSQGKPVNIGWEKEDDGTVKLTEENLKKIQAVTELNVDGWSIQPNRLTDLSGIEYFTGLESLTCSNNRLTVLDVSKNTALTSLECGANELKALDVRSNTKLTFLGCGNNQLRSLDVSANTDLTGLDCFINQLTELNVSANTKLTRLECTENRLQVLDVTANTVLTDLYCGMQTSDGETAQTLKLTLNENQKITWEDLWKNDYSNGENVVLAE